MTTPLDPDPTLLYPPMGWEHNVRMTDWFIKVDPYPVVLIPMVTSKSPSGAIQSVPGPPRPQQIVRVISTGGSDSGIELTIDGQIRKYPIVVVGKWNATIKKGDQWTDQHGATWMIDGITPFNGYEVKAGCSLVTAKPSVVK